MLSDKTSIVASHSLTASLVRLTGCACHFLSLKLSDGVKCQRCAVILGMKILGMEKVWTLTMASEQSPEMWTDCFKLVSFQLQPCFSWHYHIWGMISFISSWHFDWTAVFVRLMTREEAVIVDVVSERYHEHFTLKCKWCNACLASVWRPVLRRWQNPYWIFNEIFAQQV